MDNLEEVLDALNDFEKKAPKEIPPLLNEYLCRVAKTGETLFPWARLKGFFRAKIDDVMIKYNQDLPSDHLLNSPNVENAKFEEMRARILVALEKFHGAPFTIQRLCELIIEPKRHYKRADKFLRGIEKNVLVVSTVDPFGRKIVSESSKTLVNGLDANGEEQIKTDEGSMAVTPVASWQTDDVMATWPTQSTDNGHGESILTHNGQGDTSSTLSPSLEVPSQSSDTSPQVSSHLEGGDTTTQSSDSSSSSSGEVINPLASENSKSSAPDNSTTTTTNNNNTSTSSSSSSCTNVEQVHAEINTADHVISDTSCSDSSREKPVEVTASDCPVGVQPSTDVSNNSVSEENVEVSTVTLSADSANDEEGSVSTTENNPSKPSPDSLPDSKDLHEGKVTSSQPTPAFSEPLNDQSSEKVGDEDRVTQSNNASESSLVSPDNLSDVSTDNVSSSDSRATTAATADGNSGHLAEAAPSPEDSNVVSSAQTVLEDTAGKDNSVVSQQVSRSEEPMDQD